MTQFYSIMDIHNSNVQNTFCATTREQPLYSPLISIALIEGKIWHTFTNISMFVSDTVTKMCRNKMSLYLQFSSFYIKYMTDLV